MAKIRMPRDANQSGTIIAAILLACVGASMFQVEPMYLGAAAGQMGLEAGQIGLLAGIELVGAALGSIAAVFWVPRLNWRWVGVVALGVVVVGNLVSLTIDRLDQLIAIRFVTGLLGEGTIYAVALAVISDMRNPDRVFGLVVAAQVSLTMLAMVLLPGLIEDHGMGGVLVPLACFALVVIPFISKIPAETNAGVKKADRDEVHLLLPIFLILGAQVIWYIGVGAVWAFIERIGAASGIELQSIGSALAMGMGLGVIGALLASAIGNKINRLWMFSLAMAAQMAALYFLAGEVSWLAFTVTVVVFNISWNFALPFLLGAIASRDTSGRFTVLIIAAQGLGVAVGPIIAGQLIEASGLSAVSYFGIAACAISIATFAFVERKKR